MTDLLTYNYDEMVDYLRGAGSNNADHFGTTHTGGLELQQIPEEYAHLLLWMREQDIQSYVAIGVGNGGSFLLECCAMQRTLDKAYAIDNVSYMGICHQDADDITSRVERANMFCEATFLNESSHRFLDRTIENGMQFDCIFIDGDHSYDGVRSDFLKSLVLNPKHIILHDIASVNCPGVKAWWNQIKRPQSIEFIHGDKCGIGIW